MASKLVHRASVLFSATALVAVFVSTIHPLPSVAGRIGPAVPLFLVAGAWAATSIIFASWNKPWSNRVTWTYRVLIGVIFLLIASGLTYTGLTMHLEFAWRIDAVLWFALIAVLYTCARLLYGRKVGLIALSFSVVFVVSYLLGIHSIMIQSALHVTWLALLMMIGLQTVLLFMRERGARTAATAILRAVIVIATVILYAVSGLQLFDALIPLLMLLALYTPYWYKTVRVAGD